MTGRQKRPGRETECADLLEDLQHLLVGLVLAVGEVESALVASLLGGGGHLVAEALDLLVKEGVLLLQLLRARRLLSHLLLQSAHMDKERRRERERE